MRTMPNSFRDIQRPQWDNLEVGGASIDCAMNALNFVDLCKLTSILFLFLNKRPLAFISTSTPNPLFDTLVQHSVVPLTLSEYFELNFILFATLL